MNDYDNLIKRLRSRAYTGTVRDEAADAIEDLQERVNILGTHITEMVNAFIKIRTAYDIELVQRRLNRKKSTPSSGSQKSLQRSG
jgi:hypothetical protein